MYSPIGYDEISIDDEKLILIGGGEKYRNFDGTGRRIAVFSLKFDFRGRRNENAVPIFLPSCQWEQWAAKMFNFSWRRHSY